MAESDGLAVEEAGRCCIEDDAVLSGPSLGVLRGVMRGVASLEFPPPCESLSEVAAGGRAKSSRPGSMADIALGCAELGMDLTPLAALIEFSKDINEAGVAGAPLLPFKSRLAGAD